MHPLPTYRRLANTGSRPFPADTRLAFAYGHLLDGPLEGVHVGSVPAGEEFRYALLLFVFVRVRGFHQETISYDTIYTKHVKYTA